MSFSLLPKVLTDRITDLSVSFFEERNIRLVMLDFDNTVVPYTTNEPAEQVQTWLEEIKRSSLSLCILSNSHKSRVRKFCECYGIDCITHARKPFSKGIRACMARYGAEPWECALIGDQIYTDVLGANCCGVTSILVRSIHNHTFWLKARHVLEKPFIYAAKKRRLRL
ncbi:MAG: YqeG family HAD IIIA-type phosphatase [Ruminococcaceae bacterium]|nr:YqeG family HAD IIIA-type phosphatase [Oscillospiraceae bacterium]